MEIHKFLNLNNVKLFSDVKKLLIENNFTVKEDKNNPDLYLIYFKRKDIKFDDLTLLQKECNGIILEKDTNQIICHSFNKFYKNNETIHKDFNPNECKIYYSDEATLIRLFYYDSEWKIATKKCIDANKSKWQSDRSFCSLFYEVIDFFGYKFINDGSLDKNRNYFFLLSHIENSVVFNNLSNKIEHLATFDRVDNIEVDDFNLNSIDKKEKLKINITFDNLLESIKFNEEDYNDIKYEGFIIEQGNLRQKIFYENYIYLRNLYGNSNSRFFRFLELRKDIIQLTNYVKFFPRHKEIFEKYEKNIITNLCKYIHELYLSNKVYKTNFALPMHFKRFIYDIHGKYLM